MQLHRHGEAIAYLHERGVRSPELIEHMQIGYAPGGGCLRRWLTQLGYPLPALRQAGLVTAVGYDAYKHRIVFPAGRQSLWPQPVGFGAASPLSAGSKGGLYRWEQVRRYPEVILVEGLFDYAVLWQAGFHNVTCSMGNHLNAHQFRNSATLAEPSFDVRCGPNGSGQQAAQCLSRRLRQRGITAHLVSLPEGHDPNSFFVAGGDAHEFRRLLENACRCDSMSLNNTPEPRAQPVSRR